ncbi:predicted protein [Histoplasma capsulatum H143]|uniref:Uncharacterized protein n=1 Tax=Ajellomyces capsulatus (strain H143) TaxID=544712 RepID=C6H5V6_AJECH|nr:predicted protein [Histoplasma capsulatum H143]
MSFFCPVPAFQEDVSYGLRSVAALALIGVGLIDGVEVSTEADLACPHLAHVQRSNKGFLHRPKRVWFEDRITKAYISAHNGVVPTREEYRPQGSNAHKGVVPTREYRPQGSNAHKGVVPTRE